MDECTKVILKNR